MMKNLRLVNWFIYRHSVIKPHHNSPIKGVRHFCQRTETDGSRQLELLNKRYQVDHMTNITKNIQNKLSKNLHNKKNHPINLIKLRIQDFFYRNYVGRTGNPIYAIFDNLSPVITLNQNFDNLLVPPDHVSRHPKVSS